MLALFSAGLPAPELPLCLSPIGLSLAYVAGGLARYPLPKSKVQIAGSVPRFLLQRQQGRRRGITEVDGRLSQCVSV